MTEPGNDRARCFVGVWPPPELRAALQELVLAAPVGLRVIDPADHHITLRFLGDVDVDRAERSLTPFRFASTPAVAGPRLERLGPRHLVIPVDGLEELASGVALCTGPVEERTGALPFSGHLSIATGSDPRRLDAATDQSFECRFTVEEIALIASTADGYVTVARYPAT